MRHIFIAIMLGFALPATAFAGAEQEILAARSYLHNGNPEQAVATAQRTLKHGNIATDDRFALLSVIAQAEILRTTNQHYERVKAAIAAIDALLREFPDRENAAEFRWQRAWLWWKNGNSKQAITAARDIIAQDQQPQNLRRAWLLMSRIHISMRKFSYARSDLLQYGLQVRNHSREQAVGLAWMALVDRGEQRTEIALKNLQRVEHRWPDVITEEPEIFATYIELLNQSGNRAETLKQADRFMQQYVDTPFTPQVRLIRADIHARDESTIQEAVKEYGVLAEKEAGTSIGRKAFMRKLMLEFRHERERKILLPAMISLKKIADQNQLSLIEDEAMLDLARLWVRILDSKIAKPTSPTSNNMNYPALLAYSRAAISQDKRIAAAAQQEGSAWMKQRLQALLAGEKWLEAVSVWRQYPQLRPAGLDAEELQLGVAHAMRMLMLFDASETLLNTLYEHNRTTIRGQKIMLELAHLWFDRQDHDGVQKVMHWLNRHEFSIYRPELLLIVARMQFAQKESELARQTLESVHPEDLTPPSRLSYWQTKATIFESLSAWYRAANAWQQYRNSKGADQQRGLARQAENLFAAKEFAKAYQLYQQFTDEQRDAAWQYHTAICQLHTGQVKQGTAQLQALAGDPNSGRFAALAKLALANQQAETLLGEQP